MKIAFLGNFSVPYCSEVHHARTLEQLGHEVIQLQEGSPGNVVAERARDCDLFVWVHSHGATPTTMVGISRVLHFLEMPKLTYHLDLYKGIPSRFAQYAQHPFMTDLDHFFSVDPQLVDWLNSNGGKTRGHYLTAGVLESECYMTEPLDYPSGIPPWRYPVIFVGSFNYHPEWPYRSQLINWLMRTYPEFKGFGPDFGGSVRGDDLNTLYSEAKVVVGDSFSPMFNYPGYWSDRIPETLGRGGFLIHPRIKGIEDFYEDRKHLVLYDFGDFAELKHLIDYYLRRDNEREAIRVAGHEHVKNNHTFTHRWTHILETVNPCSTI